MNTLKHYDSRPDTLKHRRVVRDNINTIIVELVSRSLEHDESKLHEPELSCFNIYTPKLKGTTYGSDEYRQNMSEMREAIDHHDAHNRHHPEHFHDGIKGMNLIDLTEMFCDWVAATKRHDDGDIRRSIKHNQERFGYSDDVKAILLNTVLALEATK